MGNILDGWSKKRKLFRLEGKFEVDWMVKLGKVGIAGDFEIRFEAEDTSIKHLKVKHVDLVEIMGCTLETTFDSVLEIRGTGYVEHWIVENEDGASFLILRFVGMPSVEFDELIADSCASAREYFGKPDLELISSDVDMIREDLEKKYPNCLVLVEYNDSLDRIDFSVYKAEGK